MDGRPRRSAANVDYHLLERQYDDRFKEGMQAVRRRSSTAEHDVRKRKRESDSPKEVYHHTALREGLRNSLPRATDLFDTTNGYTRDIKPVKQSFHNDSDEDEIASEMSPPRHIIRLSLANGNTRAQNSAAGLDDVYTNGKASPNEQADHRSLRRSARTIAYDDEDEANEVEDTGAEDLPRDESEADSEEHYQPRKSSRRAQPIESAESEEDFVVNSRRRRRDSTKGSANHRSRGKRRHKAPSQSDEDEYVEDSAEDDLISEISIDSSRDDLNDFVEDDENTSTRRRKRTRRVTRPAPTQSKRVTRASRIVASDDEFSNQSSPTDLQAELAELRPNREQTRRRELRERTNRPDYSIPPPLTDQMIAASTPTRKRSTINMRSSFRSLYPEYNNLGLGLPATSQSFGNFGPPAGLHSDSDSSDEEGQTTKTAAKAVAGALLPAMKSMDQSGGGPSNLGKIKGSNLADADPIGIDKDVSFESVGGLENHIDQLKEMVSLPLLYPEIFQRFHITPPRGVLFHGPPGTGKTLMARALAASCSSEGRKISFYMRKGADCLSKWVGEAERQLRLLFDEAKANQPSIIFFDEIDGLAPVRSAKQDQIHASIVSTMLALMDGMDARGQVVVIGATNRPDSVDPALRRPGRFDREFYFPLPSLEARQQIITIQTSKWDPPLSHDFRAQLALQTKGYGGADLRALCTEAALNAVQRRYPQIYASNEKLVIDPASINVVPRDFMLAIKKIIPSSARSNASGAGILPQSIQPLLQVKLREITNVIDKLLPRTNKKTALEDNATAPADETSFEQENMLQMLEQMRTFRPRILLTGQTGMGQYHIGRAILHHLEGFHVQNIDLAMMFSDSASTAEASLIQAFVEAKRHKPSVLFMPEVELWFATASSSVISTLKSLLSTISANDPLLLLGVANQTVSELEPTITDIFGHGDSTIELQPPKDLQRSGFFEFIANIVAKSPAELPDALSRRPRKVEVLPIAPAVPPREPSRAERKAIEVKDKKTKLVLKAKLGPLMELVKTRYKRFKKPAIDERDIAHLLVADGEEIPDDIGDRDYIKTSDGMILKHSTGKTFYNMDINLIEERLWSNLYLTPKQFQADIEQILHDADQDSSDRERTLKAQEMHTNVLIHLEDMFDSTFIEECKAMAHREVGRHRQYLEMKQRLEIESAAGAAAEEAPAVAPNTASANPNDEGLAAMEFAEEDGMSTTNRDTAAMSPAIVAHDDTPMPDILRMSSVVPISDSVHAESSGDAQSSIHNESNGGPSIAKGSTTDDGLSVSVSVPEQPVINGLPLHAPSTRSDGPSNAAEGYSLSAVVTEPEHPPYTLDRAAFEIMLKHWTDATEGLNVDQLEEINSAAINAIWQLRAEWNRDLVAQAADQAIRRLADLLRRQRTH